MSIRDFKAALSSPKFAGFLESMSISTEERKGAAPNMWAIGLAVNVSVHVRCVQALCG